MNAVNKYVFLVFAFLCSCKPSVIHISKNSGFKVAWSSCLLPNDDGEFYVIPRRGRSPDAWDSLMRRYCREDSISCSAFWRCSKVIDPYSFFVQDQSDAVQRTWKRFTNSLPEGTGKLGFGTKLSMSILSIGSSALLSERNLSAYGIALNSDTKKTIKRFTEVFGISDSLIEGYNLMIPARYDSFFRDGELLPARMLSFRKVHGVVRMKYYEYWLQFGKAISLCDDEVEGGEYLWRYLQATDGGNIYDSTTARPTDVAYMYGEDGWRKNLMLRQTKNAQDSSLYGFMVFSVYVENGGFAVRMGGLDRHQDRDCPRSSCFSSGSLDTVFRGVGIGRALRKCVRNKSAVYNEEIRKFWRSNYFIYGESNPDSAKCIIPSVLD